MTVALACCLALLVISIPVSSLKTLKHAASIDEDGAASADLFAPETQMVFAQERSVGEPVASLEPVAAASSMSPRALESAIGLAKHKRLEELVLKEETALRWQQQALETLVEQEQAMEAEEKKLLETSKRNAVLLRKAAYPDWTAALEFIDLEKFDIVIILGAVYFLCMLVFAWIYGNCCTYEYPRPSKNISKSDPSYFSFSLFDGCRCDPDRRIQVFSCCCLPVRWADTASAPKLGGFRFWPTVVFISALLALAPISMGITAVIFTIIAIIHRQKMRKIYGMPYWTYSTCVKDCLVWSCCPCCATMQEALQMEFVDPPDQVSITLLSTPAQWTMSQDMVSINAIRRKQSCC